MRLASVDLRQLWRYYQAGIVNALFGFGLYALLVRLGANIFMAQTISTILGATFNYFTYSRHVFNDAGPAKLRFAVAYTINYLLSIATLWLVSRVVASPYGAGLITIVIVSVINFAILRFGVFTRARATAP